MKISNKEKFQWNKHPDFDAWYFEDMDCDVAAWLEKNGDKWEAFMAVPYRINDDGSEQDCEMIGEYQSLSDAMLAAQSAASYTVHNAIVLG